jgi:site-specific recombinase XerD
MPSPTRHGHPAWLLVALNGSDINLAERTIAITAKGGREDTVFLNARLCKLLARYIKAVSATDGTPLFRSRNGGRLGPRQAQLRLKHWLGVAGITKPLSVHSLRRTFAARLYSKTGDLHLVQCPRHRHITTTEIHVRVEEKALESTCTRDTRRGCFFVSSSIP